MCVVVFSKYVRDREHVKYVVAVSTRQCAFAQFQPTQRRDDKRIIQRRKKGVLYRKKSVSRIILTD